MSAAPATPGADAWDLPACRALIDELAALRLDMLQREADLAARRVGVCDAYAASARNFAHYLALRQDDRRDLQDRLAALGVSSLGRSEPDVLANLHKVLGLLHRLVGQPWEDRSAEEPIGLHGSARLLEAHGRALLGEPPAGRAVRIMVTLPSEAASDDGALIRRLVDAGMDIARINCAHDEAPAWQAMARQVREAAAAAGRPVRILMDLAGPKLRTGPIAPGPAVLKLQPERDVCGRVLRPVAIGLRPFGQANPMPQADAHLQVDAAWLAQLQVGDELRLTDARDAQRSLQVVARRDGGVLLHAGQTLYLVPELQLQRRHALAGPAATRLQGIPCRSGQLFLRPGDRLRLTRGGLAAPLGRDEVDPAQPSDLSIACTLPEVFTQVRAGERILFDDGRIEGRIARAGAEGLEVEITRTRPGGTALAADKGINLPDSALDLPALTAKDRSDLATVVQCADLVGLSFVQRAADVQALREQLQALGAGSLGLLLKIETRRAFEQLPELIFAAMASEGAGLMIARGDLAVECGYERLAEVQEEILWAAEAAHMPVVWATQVLETLAKTGQPSRAEVTDAAMGERAECVMLNKGPYIVEAMHTLDDILRRMQGHQAKKRSLLRALRAWA